MDQDTPPVKLSAKSVNVKPSATGLENEKKKKKKHHFALYVSIKNSRTR